MGKIITVLIMCVIAYLVNMIAQDLVHSTKQLVELVGVVFGLVIFCILAMIVLIKWPGS